MVTIQALVDGLLQSNDKQAYLCLEQLKAESAHSASVYPFFDQFVEMLNSSNSYVRTRGMLLLAANARWDIHAKLESILDLYLSHMTDDKPITARQCIQTLPNLANDKPHLKPDIERALSCVNPTKYNESMQSLVQKDIQEALHRIQAL